MKKPHVEILERTGYDVIKIEFENGDVLSIQTGKIKFMFIYGLPHLEKQFG